MCWQKGQRTQRKKRDWGAGEVQDLQMLDAFSSIQQSPFHKSKTSAGHDP